MRPKHWEHIDGFMGNDEMHWLYMQAYTMRSIVEIGSWMGRSTFVLCSGCKGTVYSVDHFKGSAEHQEQIKEGNLDVFGTFMKNVGHFQNLVVMKMSSKEAAVHDRIPPKVDMVFLDGAHDLASVKEDIELWYPRAEKLFCGHDMSEDGVPEALSWMRGRGKAIDLGLTGTLWRIH